MLYYCKFGILSTHAADELKTKILN